MIPPRARLFESKVVVDPCNPVAFDAKGQAVRTLPSDQSAGSVVASLLPSGAHYVKAFGTLRATDLAAGGNRQTRRAVLFYATDDDVATATIDRLGDDRLVVHLGHGAVLMHADPAGASFVRRSTSTT